ncbi:MAG: virulence RhuM family protein [Candidatus Faecimonas sp.]|nr:virulence RhuM family protein [Candidatus Faecimonas sp.]
MQNETMENNKTELIIYQSKNGDIKLDVSLKDETVWLTANQMALIFNRDEKVIRKHINNVFNDGELDKENNTQKMRVDGVKQFVSYYSLDVIISVGYRVKSLEGVRFRKWATERIKEYIIKGYTMDDERLKNLGGGKYFYELLNRIKDIRSSEKVLYRQVLDLYATAIDYNPKAEETIRFFKIVQNKFHYATHGNTAAEIIYNRADSNKPFMGLTNFKGELPSINDIEIAKNYLSEEELLMLNNLVSGYFDFAEFQALKHKPMRMKDYISQLDKILSSLDTKVLTNAGTVSHKEAIEKAKIEYQKYQIKELSPIEKEYLNSINKINQIAESLDKK